MSRIINLTATISFLVQIAIVRSSNVYWKNATLSQAVMANPEPSGLVNGEQFLYLCRGHYNNMWISGSIVFSEYMVSTCKITSFGLHRVSTFQILIAPSGATSWVKYPGKLPENAIPCGSGGYVCRGTYQNSLILGSSSATGNLCWGALDESEITISDTSKIEILVHNTYGKFLDEHFPHK